jgi:hypothetical protein
MRLSTSFVAVRKIISSTSPADFDSDKIEHLAHQIVKSEGIIRPLVLNRTSLESYEVVEGHFEYHAAVRAREIDLRRAEMIAAYILDPENDDVSESIVEQIKLLKQSATNLPANDAVTTTTLPIQREESNLNEINEILKLVLSKVNAYDSKLQKIVETTEKITLQKTLSLNESNLEVIIQKVMEKYISEARSSKTSTARPKKPMYDLEKEKSLIDGLNNFDVSQLTEKLLQAEYKIKNAEKIAKNIYENRSIQSYQSIEDFISREGFSETMSKKLLKVW